MRMVRSIIFAALLTAAGALAAGAAEQEAAPQPGAGNRLSVGAAPSPQQFSEMKNHMLKTLDMRRKELDEQKACVKAAKTMDELRRCRAERMRPDRSMRPEGRRPGNMDQQQTPPPAGGNQ